MTRREEALIVLLVVVTALSTYPNVTEAMTAWQVKQRQVRLESIQLSHELPSELADRIRSSFLPTNAAVLACGEDWVDRVRYNTARVQVRMRADAGGLAEVALVEDPEVEAALAHCVLEAAATIVPPADLTTPAFVATWTFWVHHAARELPYVEVIPDQDFGGY